MATAAAAPVAATAARDWSDLPSEIMDLIAKKIDRYGDFIAFGSVCKSFQLATSYVECPESPSNFPLLMLSDGTYYHDGPIEGEKIIETRSFYNIFTTKTFDINLPQAFGKRCLAVNFGWLLTLSLDQKIKLLHPFSKRQIDLPDCRSLIPYTSDPVCYEEYFHYTFPLFIGRAVISSSPDDASNNNCITVFVVFGDVKKIAFTRIGEDHWTVLESDIKRGGFKDIIYHKGLLYAVSFKCVVSKCNVDDEHPKLVPIAPALPTKYRTDPYYLAEFGGNLLVVVRTYSGLIFDSHDAIDSFDMEDEKLRYYTSNFVIFKRKNHRFVKLRSLGNRALFLGNNSSACIPCSKNNSIKADCIYFTDDLFDFFVTTGGGHDMGIFDFKDKTVQRHYLGPSRSIHCPPLWLI